MLKITDSIDFFYTYSYYTIFQFVDIYDKCDDDYKLINNYIMDYK